MSDEIDYHDIILNKLTDFPEGIGFNDFSKVVKNDMAPATLKKKIKELLDSKFIFRIPENPRRGQKTLFFATKGYEIYNQLLSSLEYETNKVMNTLTNIKMNEEKEVEDFLSIYYDVIYNFSIFRLMDALYSWNKNWLYNKKIYFKLISDLYNPFIQISNLFYKIFLDKNNKLLIEDYLKKEGYLDKNPETMIQGTFFNLINPSHKFEDKKRSHI
jgi:hypothetical protein